jgi:hypothetical protein
MPRRMPGNPVEPPSWVRSFDPADWQEPDKQEREAAEGSSFGEQHRAWHQRRRWVEARNQWFRETPGGQDFQLRELLG